MDLDIWTKTSMDLDIWTKTDLTMSSHVQTVWLGRGCRLRRDRATRYWNGAGMFQARSTPSMAF
ncbi:hypothetical protein L13192_00389 [Pyrenophora tritici-repentis]|nr:hypothetical protein L13192_00389 [Pyrenophora tritici-repentis]